MTRDSRWWWVGMIGSVILAVSSRWDLLEPLFPPEHTDKAHAIIETLALVVGVVSGKMSMSPRPISDEGRMKAIAKDNR